MPWELRTTRESWGTSALNAIYVPLRPREKPFVSTGLSEALPCPLLAAWARGRRPYLQLLALVVELLPVVLQLADLAVELGDHGVSLLLQLAVPGLLLLHANLPDLDVLLL